MLFPHDYVAALLYSLSAYRARSAVTTAARCSGMRILPQCAAKVNSRAHQKRELDSQDPTHLCQCWQLQSWQPAMHYGVHQ